MDGEKDMCLHLECHKISHLTLIETNKLSEMCGSTAVVWVGAFNGV